MEWLELHIDTNHAGLEPLEIFLSANGVDGVVIDDEQDFQSFLENNHQYWDYVDEDLEASMKGKSRITFYLPADDEGFARLAAAAFAAQLDPTLDELGDIKTAVSEAVTNAIVHAYPNQLGKIVMKLRMLENQTLELVIRDWGCGMEDVEQARQPLFTTGGEERSGMGFTIMESFMNQLAVKSAPGKGTTVTMRKRIASRVPAKR